MVRKDPVRKCVCAKFLRTPPILDAGGLVDMLIGRLAGAFAAGVDLVEA